MPKTAEELTDQLSELLEQIHEKTIAETRQNCSDALRDNFIDRSHTSVHYSDSPADAIISTLREVPAFTKRRAFQRLADRFDTDGIVSPEFRLGIQFCILLLNDPEFEL